MCLAIPAAAHAAPDAAVTLAAAAVAAALAAPDAAVTLAAAAVAAALAAPDAAAALAAPVPQGGTVSRRQVLLERCTIQQLRVQRVLPDV